MKKTCPLCNKQKDCWILIAGHLVCKTCLGIVSKYNELKTTLTQVEKG